MSNEEKTQEEINKWERDNFDKISGWEKDYEEGWIEFSFYDKSKHRFYIAQPIPTI